MRYEVTKVEPYTPSQFFEMVMDIDSYEKFLPYCVSSKILRRIDGASCLANMTIGFRGVLQSYTSHVTTATKDDGSLLINASQHGAGPFSVLATDWVLTPHEDGCEINFLLVMQFRVSWLEKVVGGLLSRIGPDMMLAFQKRARTLYGQTLSGQNTCHR